MDIKNKFTQKWKLQRSWDPKSVWKDMFYTPDEWLDSFNYFSYLGEHCNVVVIFFFCCEAPELFCGL